MSAAPEIAIAAAGLSKSYLVGHDAGAERYSTLRDVLARNVRGLARKTREMLSGRPIVQGDEVEEFWALKDVSFELARGEVLGIVGRNGAGKSTLLKVLSRITDPTEGRVEITGRVASLLEVGTGFHPELSGRENVYLNGAILGMSRAEIRAKFDEIVAFADIEKFVDTPVKRYSSGMYVRLAFAVAAHLETEIMVIDEVLAVGDAEFQRKCLGKMQDVGRAGRTVLFVSHNMAAVRSLCTRAILLEGGRLAAAGAVDDVLSRYMGGGAMLAPERLWPIEAMPGSHGLALAGVRVLQATDAPSRILTCHETVVELEVEAAEPIRGADFAVVIANSMGVEVVHVNSCIHAGVTPLGAGRSRVRFALPPGALRSGSYNLSVAAMVPNTYFYFRLDDVLRFTVEFATSAVSPYPEHGWRGVLGPEIGRWQYETP